MAQTPTSFLSEALLGAEMFNVLLKAITGSEEMKILEATVPGLAQIVADVELGEDAITLIAASVPIIEGIYGLLSKKMATSGVQFTIRPATTEQIDAIDAQSESMGD